MNTRKPVRCLRMGPNGELIADNRVSQTMQENFFNITSPSNYMQRLRQILFRAGMILLAVFAAIGCTAEGRKLRLLKNADSYFQAGEYDKAKIEYLNVLREERQNAIAIQRLGRIWWEQGSPIQAAPFLLAARDLIPQDVDARAKLVSVFLYAGQIEEARKETLAILDQTASHAEAMRLLVEASLTQEDLEDAERRLGNLKTVDTPGFHIARALLLFRKGDLGSAQIELERALALDPNSVEARLFLGKLYLSKGETAQAERKFKSAAELAPPRAPARLAYAEFKLRTGAIDEAKLLLTEITREAPDSLPAWRLLAQLNAAEKKPTEALGCLENVLLRDPTNIEARLLQAQIWLAQGELKKSTEALERLSATHPKVLAIKYQLALAYLKNQNAAQAALVLNQTLSENPNYVEARLLLGEINLRNGDAEQVITWMTDLLKQDPTLIQAEVILVQAYRSLHRLEDAAVIFRNRIAVNPKGVPAYLSLALILREQGKFDEARKTLETASQLEPESLAAISQLVDLDIQSRDYEAALRRVHEQLERSPNSPLAYFLEGKIYASQKMWDKAAPALLAALERQPDYPNASNLLVSTYLAADRFTEALALLENELSKRPENVGALLTTAMIYEKIKNFAKARNAYEKLISLEADLVPALNNLAYLYAEHFDSLTQAKELAQKARALQPTDPRIADTLGWVLYKSEEYQPALVLFEEAARKLPENAEVQFHLGMARYMLGERDSAREALLRAATASNDFPGKAEAQRSLALLGSANASTENLSGEELEAAVKQRPDDPLARMRLGEFYENKGALLKAANAYEEAIKINPGLLTAAVKLAELYGGSLRSSKKALEFAQKARELAPNDPKVLAMLGSAAYDVGNFAWADSLLREAARELPNDPKVLENLAWAAYSRGHVGEAQSLMEHVVELAGESEQSHDAKLFLEVRLLENGARDPVAQARVEQVLQATPGYVPALMVRAGIQADRGETDAAGAVYSEILARFPDFAPAQKKLASLYLKQPNRNEQAYNLAAKARKNLPDDPELAQILAEASYRKMEFAYAIQLLEQSANQKPLDAKQLYILGKSRLNTKDKSRSREALDRALNSGLPEELAEDAKRTIQELGNE